MKNLRPEDAQVVGLGGDRIRYIQKVDWLLPLVDDNGLVTVIVIKYTILFTDDGIMLL